MDFRRIASISAIVLGIMLVLGGIGTWTMVSSELADQNITTPDDAWLPDREVRGPLTAYAQAEVIEQHALDATGGQTFAELDRDDPLRETAMSASFLRSSLFTSVLAFGISAMAIGMGLLFVLIGLGIRDVRQQVDEIAPSVPTTKPKVATRS